MAIISNAVTIADAGAFSVSLGSKVHIKTLTASSSATLSFVHGTDGVVLDSTYPIYKFEFINIHPASSSSFTFQGDTGTNTNYNQTITSTYFYAGHQESGGVASLSYNNDQDQAQGTAFQRIGVVGNDNDSNISGQLKIFSPSSSVFVKHFIANTNQNNGATAQEEFIAGYFNTTTALTRFQFKMSSGNIDSGKIKLYGIKDS